MASDKLLISLVIPAYNEEPNLPLLREPLTALMDGAAGYDFEVIVADDHSSDGTPQVVKAWTDNDSRVRLVRLSRNCGSHVAFHAGLAECSGNAAVFLAADLQDPPELILEMAKRWREGSDVVWAVRAGREGEKVFIKLFSRLYHSMLRRLALRDMPRQGADFFLLDRKVIDAYLKIPEKNTSVMGMIFWMGFKQSFLPYVKQARASGRSKWTLSKKIKLFIDSIVSFSSAPIRLMSLLGILFTTAGLAFALVVAIGRLCGSVLAGGAYTALMTVLLTGFGLIMFMLGVLGEYLWRTYDEARGRPRYIVEERYPGQPRDRDAANPEASEDGGSE